MRCGRATESLNLDERASEATSAPSASRSGFYHDDGVAKQPRRLDKKRRGDAHRSLKKLLMAPSGALDNFFKLP